MLKPYYLSHLSLILVILKFGFKMITFYDFYIANKKFYIFFKYFKNYSKYIYIKKRCSLLLTFLTYELNNFLRDFERIDRE